MADFSTLDTGQIMTAIQSLVGYVGSVALLIGGIAMYVDLPLFGRLSCMSCPTPSGIFYILLALISGYITWTGRIKLLYITGGIACLFLAWDLYSATTIGYVVQMIFGSGLSPSMSGQMDPQISGMMQNAGFSIPTAWIILAAGAFLIVFAPQFEKESRPSQPAASPREKQLTQRTKELESIIRMYRNGDISKEEFSHLKQEIIGKK